MSKTLVQSQVTEEKVCSMEHLVWMLAPREGSLALENSFDAFDELDFTERELDGTLGVDAMLAPLEKSFASGDFIDSFNELDFTE